MAPPLLTGSSGCTRRPQMVVVDPRAMRHTHSFRRTVLVLGGFGLYLWLLLGDAVQLG